MTERLSLTASYPGDGSVIDVTVDVSQGERLVLFGPNGAGKSTFLKVMAGILPGGTRLDAAYLPQQPYLFRGSAGWNLGLGLTTEEAAWARQLLKSFGFDVAGLARPASSLSGGERQRLLLARTIARPREWVLLDEPLGALDVAERPAIGVRLADVLEGRSSMIVTHDRDEAAALGDRMAVVIGGRIRQIGSVAEVFALPEDDEVARAVGVANVWEGKTISESDGLTRMNAGPVQIEGLGVIEPHSRARAMFGAEVVTLYVGHDARPGSALNHWNGAVDGVGSTGRLVRVSVDVGQPLVALITPGSLEGMGLEIGSPVTCTVKATAVKVALA